MKWKLVRGHGRQVKSPVALCVVAAAVAALGAFAEVTDFWDTSGRAPDVTSSEVSSSSSLMYFETEHEWSSEVSIGRKINTFPPTGIILIVR